MSKLKTGLSLFALATGIAVCVAASPAQVDAATVLRYSDHNTGTEPRGRALKKWFELIEQESNGSLKIEPYWGGVLAKSREALDLVKNGTVDMALVIPDYYPKTLIANNIFKLHPVGPSEWNDIKWVYQEIYRTIPAYPNELERQNQKVLFFATGLPIVLASTYQVNGIEDLKGKKWRASSRWHHAFFEFHGAVPVSVPWSDVYMSLQTGVMDGNLADYDGTHMAKLDEVARHIFVSKSAWWGSPFLHTINLDTWKKLSKEHQDILTRTAETVMSGAFGELFTAEFDRIKKAQEQMGITVSIWSEQDLKDWANPAMLKKYHDIWVDEAKQAGLDEAGKVMDDVTNIIKAGAER